MAKNKTGIILRINKKKIQEEELPHELFLTTRQTTKKQMQYVSSYKTRWSSDI